MEDAYRAEFTKYIVEPVLGEAGVGGAMAVYGAFDAVVSMIVLILSDLHPCLL